MYNMQLGKFRIYKFLDMIQIQIQIHADSLFQQ